MTLLFIRIGPIVNVLSIFTDLKENNARTCKLASPEKISTDNDKQPASDNTATTTTSEPSANDFIADIKSAAHQAQNDTGFIYEPTSGLYYDSRTGYYYNAVKRSGSKFCFESQITMN